MRTPPPSPPHAASAPALDDVAYLKLPEVLRAFPVAVSTWYALIRQGIAPAPVKMGVGSFWRAADIRAFLKRNPDEISAAMDAARNARKAKAARSAS